MVGKPIQFVKIMFISELPNPKLLLQQLQVCGRHYNCQPYYSTTLDYARYEVLRLTEAYRSKRDYGSFTDC